jgi:hypothetical protein
MKDAEIEDFLEGFNQTTYRGMRSMGSGWRPGHPSMGGVVCKTGIGIHDVTARFKTATIISGPAARSATDLFARSWKLFLQQSGPHLGRLSPCLVLHWRKNTIPECPSIFFPALATEGEADKEMVGRMVDDA